MSIIESNRKKSGYTQVELAQKTGLSLRTIQRFEASNKEPKGHSLRVLAKAFDMESSIFHAKFLAVEEDNSSELLSIKLMNLSVLAIFGIPFGNLIIPALIWKRKRQSKLVDKIGRKIINFQITWSVLLYFLLMITPFINDYLLPSVSLILVVFFTALAINITLVAATARSFQRNDLDFLKPPIEFI